MNRRETADPEILSALILEMDKEDSIGDDMSHGASFISASTVDNSFDSFASSDAERLTLDNNRRLTVDATDMEALQRELEQQNESSSFLSTSTSTSGPSTNVSMSSPESMADVSPLSTHSIQSRHRKHAEDLSGFHRRRSSISLHSHDDESNDLISFSPASNQKRVHNRRETADSFELQNLLEMLDESNDSRGITGRESIETINLLESVEYLLEHENEEKNDSPQLIESICSSTMMSESSPQQNKSPLEFEDLQNVDSNSQISKPQEIGEFERFLFSASNNCFCSDANFLNGSKTHKSRRGDRTKFSPSPRRRSKRMSTSSVKLSNGSHSSPTPSVNSPLEIGSTSKSTRKLKSCLKPPVHNDSARKNVVFGSPDVVEFNLASPTTKLTPMAKPKAKTMYSMEGSSNDCDEIEDVETVENSRILDEWDRLTNTSDNESDKSEGTEGFDSCDDISLRLESRDSKMESNRRRRSSLLHPPIDCNSSENYSPSVIQDVSCTVNLPNTLADLLAESDCNIVDFENGLSDSVDCTEELEVNLQSLMYTIGGSFLDADQSCSQHEKSSDTPQSLKLDLSPRSLSSHSLGHFIGESLHDGSVELQDSIVLNRNNESLFSVGDGCDEDSAIVIHSGPFILEDSDSGEHTIELENVLGDLVINLSNNALSQNEKIDIKLPNQDHIEIPIEPEIRKVSCFKNMQTSTFQPNARDVVDVDRKHNNSFLDLEEVVISNPLLTVSNGQAVLNRLRNLNAGARRNSLQQCSTPMASNNNMSAGMKRHSFNLLTSARKVVPLSSTLHGYARNDLNTNKLAQGEHNYLEQDLPRVESSFKLRQPPPMTITEFFSSIDQSLISTDAPQVEECFLTALMSMICDTSISLKQKLLESLTNLISSASSECQDMIQGIEKQTAASWNEKKMQAMTLMQKVGMKDAVALSRQGALSQSSRLSAADIWRKWETQLAVIAVENFQNLFSHVTQHPAVLETVEAKQSSIDILHIKIREARKKLSVQQELFLRAGEEISEALQSKKDIMITVVSTAESDHKPVQVLIPSETCSVDKLLAEAKQKIDLVNRFTYCRIVSYTANKISVLAALTQSTSVRIEFNITEGSRVDGVYVEIEHAKKKDGTHVDLNSRENQLVSSYFKFVLCADDVRSPLSAAVLTNIVCGNDVRNFLLKVLPCAHCIELYFYLNCIFLIR